MEFYLNTIPEWLLACLIILASFVVAKIFYWTCKKIFLNLTKKTKTTLDDILLDMLEEPVVFGIILVGIWFSTLHLEFFDSIQGYLEQAFYILFTALLEPSGALPQGSRRAQDLLRQPCC